EFISNANNQVLQKEESLQKAKNANDSLMVANSIYENAIIDQLQGQNNLASEKLNFAFEIYKQLNNTRGIANCLNNLGAIYRYSGFYDKALDYHTKAMNKYIFLADKEGELKSLNNIGIVYRMIGEKDKAKECYIKALTIGKNINSDALATVYNSIGSFYWYENKNDSALLFYKKALEFKPNGLELREKHCAVLNNIGNVYCSINKLDSALFYYKKSLSESKKYNFINLSAITYKNIGKTHLIKGNFSQANIYLNRSIPLTKKSNLFRVLIEVYSMQSELYERQGNFKNSLLKFKKYSYLRDSVLSEERMKKIAELEVEYEMQQMEKNALILNKDIVERDLKLIRSKNLIISAIFLIIVLLLIALFIYNRNLNNIKLKRRLQLVNEDLEKRVLIRTKSLGQEIEEHKKTENKLVNAKEKAEESDRLKSAFLANMSHEIRTPMNAINGFSELLSTQPEISKASKNYIHLIQSNSDKLLTLIEDIIDISKIEANQINIHINSCNIHLLLNELKHSFMPLANMKKIALLLVLPQKANSLSIKTDPYRLNQILSNLLSNALKFTDYGYVEFGYNLNSKNEIEFFVQDTGIGIPADAKEFIFKRFRRVEETGTKIYGGTGLGLSISSELVNLLNGKIWVESEIDKGSTFKFKLPLIRVDGETIDFIDNTEEIYNWKGKNILVTDDDKDCSLLLSNILGTTQANILFAKTGYEAVELCEKQKIDLVLMDLLMPELNGFEAIALIKDQFPEIYIIVQTAYAMPNDKQKSIQAGSDDYLTKPIKKDILLAKMAKFLNA
ncbi:MAG: tetratricopeptide repeat protein, partial [Salinivirgaceae bacterium]|nr:tetratricopeptide repeat protein [Salinivirgaceae bacterium]